MHYWTEKELKFIRKHIPNRSSMEMTELFNRHFGLSVSLSQMRGTLDNYKIHSGYRPPIQPGHPIYRKGRCYRKGTESIDHGEVIVKLNSRRLWKPKRVLIWEAANGKVPKGHVIIFSDGDKTNLSLDNLLMVSRKELVVMNHFKLVSDNPNLTKTGKLVADVHLKISERKRGIKKTKRKANHAAK